MKKKYDVYIVERIYIDSLTLVPLNNLYCFFPAIEQCLMPKILLHCKSACQSIEMEFLSQQCIICRYFKQKLQTSIFANLCLELIKACIAYKSIDISK